MDAVASHCEVLRPVGRDGLEMAGRDSAAMLKPPPRTCGGRFPARRPSVPAYSCGRTQTVTERDTDKGPKQAADGIRFPSRFASQLNVFDIWNGRGILLVGRNPNRINAY